MLIYNNNLGMLFNKFASPKPLFKIAGLKKTAKLSPFLWRRLVAIVCMSALQFR
jgi:hypothetical protein